MERELFAKSFIFSLIFISLFSGCEIPHSNGDDEVALCNIYDKEKSKIILCPQLGNIKVDLGEIELYQTVTIWFLNSGDYGAFEFQNSILYISDLVITDNNTSFIYFYPLLIGGTTLLVNGGDINFTISVTQ
jgi:hypothetical protein